MPRHEIPSALLEAYEEKRMKAFNAKLEPVLARYGYEFNHYSKDGASRRG